MNKKISKKKKDKDYATGKAVDFSKPEEKVRQETERWLINELGYSQEQIDIEYRIRIGSRSPRVDIAVFRTNDQNKRNQHKDVLGLIETKSVSMAEAEEQLWSYMAASDCEWGVAATSEARQFYRKAEKRGIDRVPAIPVAGISINQMERLSKSDLKPVSNLKLRFRSILYHLYSNTNIQSRTRLCNEMTKILFCKIYDENLDTDFPYFQSPPNKSHQKIKNDIEEKLWKEVLTQLSMAEVFPSNELIILDPDSVAYIVGELERVSLKETDCDAIGAAFEVFAEKYFVGEKGEFFTPRIAVKHAVKMLDPNYKQTVIDPACGSGGFIIYALEHVWEKIKAKSPNKEKDAELAPKFIYGIDKEPDLVKVARSYMALIGDGHTNIVDADSLKPMEKWSEKARVIMTDNGNIRKKFKFVFTNPPFGADIKVEHTYILKNYDLGHKWEKSSGKWVKTDLTVPTAPQILFLELCTKLLEENGRMCIVLPESVLGNPSQGYVRQWLLQNLKILSIWDCPQNLFLPHTNTKTCILFAEASRQNNQAIMMSVIEKSGHDARGAEVKSDDGKLIEDFSRAVNDWNRLPDQTENWEGDVSFFVGIKDLINDNMLVPRIYKKYRELGEQKPEIVKLKDLEKRELISISTVPCDVRQKEYESNGTIPFIRTSDIGVMELRPSLKKVTEDVFERNKTSQDLKPLDILMIKDGTLRIGESVMLLDDDMEVVLQGHFYRIRPLDSERLNPYYLYWALLEIRSVVLDLVVVQSTLSSITIERLRDIGIPLLFKDKQEEIGNKMKEILLNRKTSLKEYNKLKP